MRFFNSIVIAASALAALVSAASNVQFTDAPTGSAEAGKTYTLKWSGATNTPATILLKEGPSNALKTVDTIATDVTGGTFTWTVPKDIAPGGDYALQITAGAEPNYWSIGAIAGGTAATTTNSASSSASSILSSASSKISSLSSKLSSATASTSASTSAGTATVTSSRNSTSVSTPTLTSTSSSGTTSSTSGSSTTSSGGAAPSDSNNGGANMKSNAALVLGAVAAMAYLG